MRMIMSIKCLMNGMEVNYPCSHVCALFGDCVTAFEAQKKENVRTNADRIRSMTDDELNDLFHEIYNSGVDDASSYEWGQRTNSFEWTMEWLQKPAEENDYG